MNIQKSFIADKTGRLSANETKGGAVKIIDGDLVIRKEITSASSTLRVLDAQVKEIVGISDFEGKKISASFLAMGVSIAAGTVATSGSNTPASATYSPSRSAIPLALLNGKLVVKQGGEVLLRKNINDLVHDGTAAMVRGKAVFMLDNPQLIEADKEVDITVEFANGQSIPNNATNQTYMEIKFHGGQVIS